MILMTNQWIPPTEEAPTLPLGISRQDALRIWIDLMKASDKLVMAGLVREVGSENLRDAYRAWYAEQAERHGRHMAQLAKRLNIAGE